MSLLIVNRDKAQASSSAQMPTGTLAAAPPQSDKTEISPELEQFIKRYGSRSAKEIAENIDRVNKRVSRDESGKIRFTLSD